MNTQDEDAPPVPMQEARETAPAPKYETVKVIMRHATDTRTAKVPKKTN
jgi:hypothetical protein